MSKENQTRHKRIYIAGKMRGVKYYNFPAFDKAALRLRSLGFIVCSPAEMDRNVGLNPMGFTDAFDWNTVPPWFHLHDAIARDNIAIDTADAIYVMREGFATSEGSKAEVERALSNGILVLWDTMTDAEICKDMGVPYTEADTVADGIALDVLRQAVGADEKEVRYTDPATGGQALLEPVRASVLTEAKRLICGDRNKAYGPPTKDHARAASILTSVFGDKLRPGAAFTARDISVFMIAVKLSRLQHSPKRDSWVDIAGYAGCGAECDECDGQANNTEA